MPGLKLTADQACRLWAVNTETCEAAIAALLEEGFLHKTGTGKFIALPTPSGSAARVADMGARVITARCPHCQKLNTFESASMGCAGCRRIVTYTAIPA